MGKHEDKHMTQIHSNLKRESGRFLVRRKVGEKRDREKLDVYIRKAQDDVEHAVESAIIRHSPSLNSL